MPGRLQNLRGTEHSIGSTRSAAALKSKVQNPLHGGLPEKNPRALQVCTFAGNRLQVLRCTVCDSVRGTSREAYAGNSMTEAASPLEILRVSAPGQEKGKGRAGGLKGDHACACAPPLRAASKFARAESVLLIAWLQHCSSPVLSAPLSAIACSTEHTWCLRRWEAGLKVSTPGH